jgi:hypothetical protein
MSLNIKYRVNGTGYRVLELGAGKKNFSFVRAVPRFGEQLVVSGAEILL